MNTESQGNVKGSKFLRPGLEISDRVGRLNTQFRIPVPTEVKRASRVGRVGKEVPTVVRLHRHMYSKYHTQPVNLGSLRR